jgi:hypothetical protein
LVRTGRPVSTSARAPDVGTAVPDSPGDVPSRVGWSVPLLPDGHSATTDGARFSSRVNTVSDVVTIGLSRSTVWVGKAPIHVQTTYAALYLSLRPHFVRAVRKGA